MCVRVRRVAFSTQEQTRAMEAVCFRIDRIRRHSFCIYRNCQEETQGQTHLESSESFTTKSRIDRRNVKDTVMRIQSFIFQ